MPVQASDIRSAAAAVLISPGQGRIHALFYGRWIVHNAAITFAYADAITSGAGPVLVAPLGGTIDVEADHAP